MKFNQTHVATAGFSMFFALQACTTPSGQECYNNNDCESGEICNSNGACSSAYIPPARDASFHDLWYLDHRQEDRSSSDSAIEDAGVVDAMQLDASQDAGSTQVDWFSVCANPSALALSDDASELYVSCIDADQVQVYDPLAGQSKRVLSQLSSPCAASSLVLREDYNQLWLSCSSPQDSAVHCVRPDNGAQIQSPISDTSTTPRANIASAGDLISWVSLGGNNFSIQQLSHSGSSSLLANQVLGGTDVAINASADRIYLLQLNSQDNAIRRFDHAGGNLIDISAVVAQARFIAAAKVNSASLNRPLLVASNQQYIRIGEDGVSVGSIETISSGVISSLVSKADGSAFFIAAADFTQGNSWIYHISSDPLVATALISKQEVPNCQISALQAAADGRVFAACSDTDRIYVKQF